MFMNWRQIVLMVGVGASLSGCLFLPYVGRDYHDEDLCIGLDMAYASYGDGRCKHLSQRRKKDMPQDAPESSKRVIYTEAQRLAMANDAARRLYPRPRFWMAHVVAEESFRHAKSFAEYRSCNRSLAARSMASRLENQFSDAVIFDLIAQHWSQRYSDAQLATIQRASYTTDLTGNDPAKQQSIPLPPQYPIGGASPLAQATGIFELIDAYVKANEPALIAIAKEESVRAETSGQFDAKALCKLGGGYDKETSYYNFTLDQRAMDRRDKKGQQPL
ncbi:MAG: hypothetical protein DI582_10620 [Azospirillum brasilense]|nr:MAG: hypothetical protein DI582_10620 [Azospirillum brasilense]